MSALRTRRPGTDLIGWLLVQLVAIVVFAAASGAHAGVATAEHRYDLPSTQRVAAHVLGAGATRFVEHNACPEGSALHAAWVRRTATTPSDAGVATEGGAGLADDVAGKLPWNSYAEYPKVSVGGREYAQIGDRLYTQHAVDRMMPSGLGSSGAPGGAFGPGRIISPNFVEDVIRSGAQTTEVVDGVTRTIFTSGTVTVVTEDGGRLIVTVMTH